MFKKVLIANRGEIARRILRTLSEMNVASVAVYSDSDSASPHVLEADEAVYLGPDPATNSYLDVQKVVAAALSSGAEAIHPGYGFLSENVQLKRAATEAGIVFIGPNELALEVMGDKARSRERVSANGVPIVPGFSAADLSDEEIIARASEMDFPLLLKPSAGGGGKGMEEVWGVSELHEKLASARRVATAAFGDDSIIVEKLITKPRHVEVQIFADQHGKVISLGERECTLQRRHQKVIEEAPCTAITEDTRQRLFEAAINAAKSVDYVGAGTVEFLVDAQKPTEFYFIEMNTRLQVEHPVTEEVTGVDMVEMQLQVAYGLQIPDSPTVVGHAVEARVYAEDPEKDFLPSIGEILWLKFGEQVRVDSAVENGSSVSQFYDPMIAKIISYGADRTDALQKLDSALAATEIFGVKTNVAFLRALLADERVKRGELETGLIETMLPFEQPEPQDEELLAAAQLIQDKATESRWLDLYADDLWHELSGWRLSGAAEPVCEPVTLRESNSSTFHVEPNDKLSTVSALVNGETVWTVKNGVVHTFRQITRRQAALQNDSGGASGLQSPECTADMPGQVTVLHVSNGDAVKEGDILMSIEAMKMEHAVRAGVNGTVKLLTQLGAQVQRDQVLAVVETENI